MPHAPEMPEARPLLPEELRVTRRARIWLVVAVLFTLVNLAGTVYAALAGEVLHADVHAALMFIGAYFVWRLGPGRAARD